MKKRKGINPLNVVHEQFQQLRKKLKSTDDAWERTVLIRRLVNLIGVIEFLISINRGT